MKKQNFANTKTLLKLAMKRDRIKLPIWLLSIFGIVALITKAYGDFTPQDIKEIVVMASTSPGMRFLIAPLSPDSVGELGQFFLIRMSAIIAVLVAMMNIQLIIRHTRNNEETGCSELISSTAVGRYSSLTSALILAIASNILVSILIALGLIVNGLSIEGSLIAGASYGALGILFSAIAGITAQLSESSRGSNGLSAVIIGVIFVINSIGNVMGTVNADGMGYESAWPVWLSPLGWAQQMHPFDQNNWWILSFFIVSFILLIRTAFVLVNHRDVGRGILPARKGSATAAKWLQNPLGLTFRLQRIGLMGWIVGLLLLGLIFGASSTEFGEIVEDMDAFPHLKIAGEMFMFSLIGLMAAVVSIFTMLSILRIYSEEKGGPLESVLSTAVSRTKVFLSYITVSILGSIAIIVAFSFGIALASEGGFSEGLEYVKAGFLQATAIMPIAGLIIVSVIYYPHFK
ncbi:UNVERIFIED_CONTAM: ABC-2 type transport system permease protein [Acetivibrio alkalicellulosi]